MLRPSPAFRALFLLLVTGASTKPVSPTTDVTVSCQNVKVTASWNCDKHHQQTTFRIKLTGAAMSFERETTECQYDLTPFIWASESHYMNGYFVAVMAVRGGNQSAPAQSKTFSFNNVKTVDLTCSLDFPPVEVKKMDSGVSVSFENPFHFYPELRNATKSPEAAFSFTITSSLSTVWRGVCSVGQKTCKHGIDFPEEVEECVTLDGTLFDGGEVGQVSFTKTARVCASDETSMMVLVAPLVVAALIIAVVAAVVCKVKPWHMKEPVTLPQSLTLEPNEQPHYLRVRREYFPVSRLTLEPRSPLVTSEQEEEKEEEEEEKRIGMPDLDTSGSEGHGTDNDDDDYTDRQADTRSTSVNSDEERSAYDCPHSHHFDLGDGELVEGYGK